jgi:hypothetical protein
MGRAPTGLPHSDPPGSQAASASPGHFAAWPRPSSAAIAKASTLRPSSGRLSRPLFHYLLDPGTPVRSCVPDRLAPAKDASSAHAARWTAAPSRSLPGSRRPCSNRTFVMLLIQCAWMNRHDQKWPCPHPRPQDPTGLAWRIVKVHQLGKRQERTRRTTCFVPTFPPRSGWARLDSNQGPRPYQGRALTT